MQARLLKNGTDVVAVSFGGITGAHVSEVTALWPYVAVVLGANDTVELQGNITGADGYFAADHSRFWGFRVCSHIGLFTGPVRLINGSVEAIPFDNSSIDTDVMIWTGCSSRTPAQHQSILGGF